MQPSCHESLDVVPGGIERMHVMHELLYASLQFYINAVQHDGVQMTSASPCQAIDCKQELAYHG